MRLIDKSDYSGYLEAVSSCMEFKDDRPYFPVTVIWDWAKKVAGEDQKVLTFVAESHPESNYVEIDMKIYESPSGAEEQKTMVSSATSRAYVESNVGEFYDSRDYAYKNAYYGALGLALSFMGYNTSFLIAELRVAGLFNVAPIIPEGDSVKPADQQAPKEAEPSTLPVNQRTERENAQGKVLDQILQRPFERSVETEKPPINEGNKVPKQVEAQPTGAPITPVSTAEKSSTKTVGVEESAAGSTPENQTGSENRGASELGGASSRLMSHKFHIGSFAGKTFESILNENGLPHLIRMCEWVVKRDEKSGTTGPDYKACKEFLAKSVPQKA